MLRAAIGILETIVLVAVLVMVSVWIGMLLLITGTVRIIVDIANDPNASPYRQVR